MLSPWGSHCWRLTSGDVAAPDSLLRKTTTTTRQLTTLHTKTSAMTSDQTDTSGSARKKSCSESAADKVDSSISGLFYRLGLFCNGRPKTTIGIALAVSILCAMGMAKLNTENRPDKLWVPQNTEAEVEQKQFLSFFPANSRFQSVIASSIDESSKNVLTKSQLVNMMKLHESVETDVSEYEGTKYTFTDLCTVAGG
jgi:predicted RND superfamily exporter protein